MALPISLPRHVEPIGVRRAFFRLRHILLSGLVVSASVLAAALVTHEVQTSALQSRLLSAYAARLTFTLEPGPGAPVDSDQLGPFDQRRGYSRLTEFRPRLEAAGYAVTRQARMSPELSRLVKWGISPPFRETAAAGLVIHAPGGVLYDSVDNGRLFRSFEEVPPLVVQTLAFLENRELLEPSDPRKNPAIEWDRLAWATVHYAGTRLGIPSTLQGGSTLATQLEKFRHSPGGRTNGALDKLRQLTSASLRAYRDGPDTRDWRRSVVVDFLNSMPMAGAPGLGEVHGLGNGLYAWFGLDLARVQEILAAPDSTREKARVFKHVLALLTALPAPTRYLVESRPMLEARVENVTHLLIKGGIISPDFGAAVLAVPIVFLPAAPIAPPSSFVHRKAVNATRVALMSMLGLPSLYDLDGLHLRADTTIDLPLQNDVTEFFQRLADSDFVAAQGLRRDRALGQGEPRKVTYSLLLLERTPQGNALRVQADNLDQPLDINEGVKMELGSTAKLRTLAHYLEVIAILYQELSPLDRETLRGQARTAADPLTRWTTETLLADRTLDLDSVLQRALRRKYSASPHEVFFTGGGVHRFENFDPADNRRILTLEEALHRSVNLVFIRLMRDLVRYHRARLPYDTEAVLGHLEDPLRHRMLAEVADDEARLFLRAAYRKYHGRSPQDIITTLLGRRATSARHLAMLFFAWHRGASDADLAAWLAGRLGPASPRQVRRLMKAYGNPRLNLSDFGYLLDRHPLQVWCAGELVRQPNLRWEEILESSEAARRLSSAWLFRTRNRHAQDRRLRIRIERDAFRRMTPYWQRLGFPFGKLVPSYATAIGSSSDRPSALAELMGIIVNGGMKRATVRIARLHFAEGTPHETLFEPTTEPAGSRVMELAVAHALRDALAGVVEKGTASRVHEAFVGPEGRTVSVGGKTGSGDNRYETFNRSGGVTSSRPVNRTATFVFYIGDRYFGVLTAFVPGKDAGAYRFTSALPLSILKLLAPAINTRAGAHFDAARLEPAPEQRRSPHAETTTEGSSGHSEFASG